MSHERRIFLEEIPASGQLIPSAQDCHHLRHVLRVSCGAHVVLVDKLTGREFDAIVALLEPELTLKILAARPELSDRPSGVKGLIFALGRNPVNDLVCEKSAELGVEQLTFWQAGRSVISLSQKDVSNKLVRWQKIAESAARQSGKRHLMQVTLALTMSDLTAKLDAHAAPQEPRLCCSLSSRARSLKTLLPLAAPVHLLVGPAGDLTNDEEDLLQAQAFKLISLGGNLLRSETAALAGIGMLQAVWELSRS